MVRTQISLDEVEMKRLRELARQRGVSMASLLREAVDRYLEDAAMAERRARARAAIGRFSSGEPGNMIGRDHDAELDDAFGQH